MYFEYTQYWGYYREEDGPPHIPASKKGIICIEIENTDDKNKTNDTAAVIYYPPPVEIGPQEAPHSQGTNRVRYNK